MAPTSSEEDEEASSGGAILATSPSRCRNKAERMWLVYTERRRDAMSLLILLRLVEGDRWIVASFLEQLPPRGEVSLPIWLVVTRVECSVGPPRVRYLRRIINEVPVCVCLL